VILVDFQSYAVEWVVSALEWLDDWPVGLKLNTPLSRFFRIGFTILVSTWSGEFRISGNNLRWLMNSLRVTYVIQISADSASRNIDERIWRLHHVFVSDKRHLRSTHISPSNLS
jgi:hypothetical protein